MSFRRASGILLHPTSLPSPYGIGDLGSAAYAFVDFLAATHQQLWQVLPLGPTGYGNSPYSCYSAMAGNALLLSLDILQEKGWLSAADLGEIPDFPVASVDYDLVTQYKLPLLMQAAERFRQQATPEETDAFQAFCASRQFWLDEYTLYMALKREHQMASWHNWDKALALREPAALEEARSRLAEPIYTYKFLQFEFCNQWSALKKYANERQIQIIGDMPIYVAHDSVDVWAFPHNFCLDSETLKPAIMAGVPPDYFSDTGQLWGNPVYNWAGLKERDFKWWIERFTTSLEYVDFIRIDHFRGFESYWAVPGTEMTAMHGEWVLAPGAELFEMVRSQLGHLPILAEDLGVITPEVEALRDQFEFPGMKILQFAFGSGAGNPYLPFNYNRNCLVYTGTHDNNTTVGWWDASLEHERQDVLAYIGQISPDGIHWDFIRLALSSIANQAIIPLQDIFGLGAAERMNIPGTAKGNWDWRYEAEMLSTTVCDRLQRLTDLYGRAPQP